MTELGLGVQSLKHAETARPQPSYLPQCGAGRNLKNCSFYLKFKCNQVRSTFTC